MSILTAQNLTKKYGSITALDSLDLDIQEGQAFGLLGPNGSGKTTTLGVILSILKPNNGTFEWFDGRYGDNPRKRIGAILETPNFYPYLNATENLEIVRRIKKSENKDFEDVLRFVNLFERRKSAFSSYSLGMKQRLAIAATLLSDPDVLIFDEPTNGLDPQGIAEVRDTLINIVKRGKTVILASHILDEVEKICTHVAIIKKGKLMATGPVGSILSNDKTVELSCQNRDQLKNWLSNLNIINDYHEANKYIECQVHENFDVAELNKMAFEANITLTHLVERKRSLEQEFLEITKNK